MRMRENRLSIQDSLSTTLDIIDRKHLVRLIVECLGKQGIVVTDEMIHVSHYGFDDRIDWDDHIIVVEGHGVFGFTDEPCPEIGIEIVQTGQSARPIFGDELSLAYGVVC